MTQQVQLCKPTRRAKWLVKRPCLRRGNRIRFPIGCHAKITRVFSSPRWRKGLYPSTVEAQITDGSLKFRARFSARPNNTTFAFYSFHGISKSEYTRKTTSFKQAGFRELCVNSVVDEQGLKLFSGTWIRKRELPLLRLTSGAEAGVYRRTRLRLRYLRKLSK